MKQFRKRMSLFFGCLFALSVVLVSCGDATTTAPAASTSAASGQAASPAASASASTATSATTAAANATPAASGQAATLSIMVAADDYNDSMPKFYDKVKDMFQQQHPGVTINFDVVPGNDLYSKLSVEGAAGGGQHDAAQTYDVPNLASKGYLEDVSSAVTGWPSYNSLPQGIKDRITYQGKVYATSLFNNTNGLWYNKDILKQTGVDPASLKTVPDLVAAFAKIKAAGLKAANGQEIYGLTFQPYEWYGAIFMYGAGGQMTDSSNTKVTLNSPEMKEGFQTFRDIFAKGYAPKPDQEYGINRGLFEQGRAAFWIAGEWDAIPLNKALGDKLGFAALPTWKQKAAPLGGIEWVVPKGSKNTQLASQWLLFVLSDQVQQMIVKDYKRPPSSPALYNLPELTGDPVLSVIVGTVKDQAVLEQSKRFADNAAANKDFGDMFDKLLSGPDDVGALLKTYQDKLQKDLK